MRFALRLKFGDIRNESYIFSGDAGTVESRYYVHGLLRFPAYYVGISKHKTIS